MTRIKLPSESQNAPKCIYLNNLANSGRIYKGSLDSPDAPAKYFIHLGYVDFLKYYILVFLISNAGILRAEIHGFTSEVAEQTRIYNPVELDIELKFKE